MTAHLQLVIFLLCRMAATGFRGVVVFVVLYGKPKITLLATFASIFYIETHVNQRVRLGE